MFKSAIFAISFTLVTFFANAESSENPFVQISKQIITSVGDKTLYFGEIHNVGDNRLIFLNTVLEYQKKYPRFYIATEYLVRDNRSAWDAYVADDSIPVRELGKLWEEPESDSEFQHLIKVAGRPPIVGEVQVWMKNPSDRFFIRALRDLEKASHGRVKICGIEYPELNIADPEQKRLKKLRVSQMPPQLLELAKTRLEATEAQLANSEVGLERDYLMAQAINDCDSGSLQGLVHVGAFHARAKDAVGVNETIPFILEAIRPGQKWYAILNTQIADGYILNDSLTPKLAEIANLEDRQTYQYFERGKLAIPIINILDRSNPEGIQFSTWWDGYILGPPGTKVHY